MTDDRLYPPAAVYLTGALARSARQPRIDGLEAFVWFDVPAPDGGVVSQPIHETLLAPKTTDVPQWERVVIEAESAREDRYRAALLRVLPEVRANGIRVRGRDGHVTHVSHEGALWTSLPGLLDIALYIAGMHPDQSTVDASEHDDGPIPFPGEDVARRLPGGGWAGRDVPISRFPAREHGGIPCPSDALLSLVGGANWSHARCNAHLGDWHVAAHGDRIVAVWPSSAVAVQQPGGGAS